MSIKVRVAGVALVASGIGVSVAAWPLPLERYLSVQLCMFILFRALDVLIEEAA